LFTAELTFECYQDSTIDAVNDGITQLIDALRYNGQILGREFPTSMHDGVFVTRVVCPEEDSLQHKNHSEQVKIQLQTLADVGLLQPQIRITGMDLHSDNTDPCDSRSWQVLYTHYLSTCSPLRCGEHLAPVPLYKVPTTTGDHQQLLRWQIDWSCADELQMHGTTLAKPCRESLTDWLSPLNKTGSKLAKEIEQQNNIPTYYYLYHIDEEQVEDKEDCEKECKEEYGDDGERDTQAKARRCPNCQGNWLLAEPIQGIFDFKCDSCRIVSNLPW